MKNLSAIYTNKAYKTLNPTARDVFFLIYNQFTLSKKSVSEGKTNWKDDNGVFCYLGQKEIAAILGKTDRTVRRAIEALKEAKLITVIERGARKKAKLYVHEIVKSAKPKTVEIKDEQIKTAFEKTFGEKANNLEAKALNELSKDNKTDDLVEAINRSKDVQYKRARIKYIKLTLTTVIEEKSNPKPQMKKPKRVIREEQVPEWLKPGYEKPVQKEMTELEQELFSIMQESTKYFGKPEFREYATRIAELKKLIQNK